MQSNYRHNTQDNNTFNFWLLYVILGLCCDTVFHFSKSTNSDITKHNTPSIIHQKTNGLSCTANMHIQWTSLQTQSNWNASIHTAIHNLSLIKAGIRCQLMSCDEHVLLKHQIYIQNVEMYSSSYRYNNVANMDSMMLSGFELKLMSMPLFTVCVVIHRHLVSHFLIQKDQVPVLVLMCLVWKILKKERFLCREKGIKRLPNMPSSD